MQNCGCDLRWFRITRGQNSQCCFSHSRSLQSLAAAIRPCYHDSRPSLVLFIGKTQREGIVQKLLRTDRHEAHENVATIREWCSPRTTYPVFVAESTLEENFTQMTSSRSLFCQNHQDISYPVHSDAGTDLKGLHHRFLIHTVLPFAAAVILCADDYGDDDLCDAFDQWQCLGLANQVMKPQLIFVSHIARPFGALVKSATATGLFRGVEVMNSKRITIALCRTNIMDHVRTDREARSAEALLFTSSHFAEIHERMVKHIANSEMVSFDPVKLTRPTYNANNHSRHLQSLLLASSQVVDAATSSVFAYIASTLALYAWAPGSHTFSADALYNSLFKPAIIQAFDALEEPLKITKGEEICHALRDHRQKLVLQNVAQPALDLHLQETRELQFFRHIKSHTTCLFCLMRTPQHVLLCGHALCDVCVRQIGQSCMGEYCFDIQHCPLCLKTVKFRRFLKPPTCGVRALSLDGGGARGIISIEYLLRLQATLAEPFQLRLLELFDFVVGTSAGGLHALALYMTGRDENDWKMKFGTVVRDTIHAHESSHKALLERIKRGIRFWTQDGIYDSVTLESIFRDLYGHDKTLFGWSPKLHMPKIAITATSIGRMPKTRLFTNYNIESPDDSPLNDGSSLDYGYVLRTSHQDEPRVWQIARATSAAPLFFPTITIGEASYQDGGVRTYNNPTWLCDTEIRQIWGKSSTYDVLLSLGTGFQLDEDSSPRFRHQWRDGFLPRLYHNLATLNNNHESHLMYSGRLDAHKSQDYFRLDVGVPDLPRMNDADAMDRLSTLVQVQSGAQSTQENITNALLVASFFFELDDLPTFQSGMYLCRGSIRCRNVALPVLKVLQAHNASDLEFLLHTGDNTIVIARIKGLNSSPLASPEGTVENFVCKNCQLFKVPAEFLVRHPQETISISLRMAPWNRNISGFPNPISWFAKQQQLDAIFGRDDHKASGANYGCDPCASKCLKRAPPASRLRYGKRLRRSLRLSPTLPQSQDDC